MDNFECNLQLEKSTLQQLAYTIEAIKGWNRSVCIRISDAGTGAGGPVAPQYFADQLTLFQPRGADSTHPLLPAPPTFSTFRHH